MKRLLAVVMVAGLVGAGGVELDRVAQAAQPPPWWWAVTKIDARLGSVSVSSLTFMGPVPLLEQCNPLLEASKAGFEEKKRRFRESDPTGQMTLSVARCQTGVVITSRTNSPEWMWATLHEWWISAVWRVEFRTASAELFVYQGPYATQMVCSAILVDFKQSFSIASAVVSRQNPGYKDTLLSPTCERLSIAY